MLDRGVHLDLAPGHVLHGDLVGKGRPDGGDDEAHCKNGRFACNAH